MSKLISINNIVFVNVVDNEQLEIHDANSDITIHNGIIREITSDRPKSTFTVTFETN